MNSFGITSRLYINCDNFSNKGIFVSGICNPGSYSYYTFLKVEMSER